MEKKRERKRERQTQWNGGFREFAFFLLSVLDILPFYLTQRNEKDHTRSAQRSAFYLLRARYKMYPGVIELRESQFFTSTSILILLVRRWPVERDGSDFYQLICRSRNGTPFQGEISRILRSRRTAYNSWYCQIWLVEMILALSAYLFFFSFSFLFYNISCLGCLDMCGVYYYKKKMWSTIKLW